MNFAATIFVSAFLLFQIEPLVSKYILPWFGGSPAVWTTCMLFFQTLLFGGYAYAHFVSQRLAPRAQATLHLVVILTALALLRVVPDASWKPTDSSDPIGRILLLLSVSVGMPYFVLSTTATPSTVPINPPATSSPFFSFPLTRRSSDFHNHIAAAPQSTANAVKPHDQ